MPHLTSIIYVFHQPRRGFRLPWPTLRSCLSRTPVVLRKISSFMFQRARFNILAYLSCCAGVLRSLIALSNKSEYLSYIACDSRDSGAFKPLLAYSRRYARVRAPAPPILRLLFTALMGFPPSSSRCIYFLCHSCLFKFFQFLSQHFLPCVQFTHPLPRFDISPSRKFTMPLY